MFSAIAVMTYDQPQLVKDLANIIDPLIVVDNGSHVPIPYTTIRVPENRFFTGGWNYAMKEIDATWVAMLNDDITRITQEMIYMLIDEAEDQGYDVISPAFNSPHEHMQPHYHGHNSLREVKSIDWVAPIIRKQVWDEVGGFNTDFLGYGSDLDISYRIRKLNYRMAVDDYYVINHIGGVAAIASNTQIFQGNLDVMNQAFQKNYGASDWIDFTNRFLNML